MNENVFNLKKINAMNDKCVDLILEDKTEEALVKLKNAESQLEKMVVESGKKVSNETIILILHNIACCFQKLKSFENCVTYLEAVIFHYDNMLTSKYNITNSLKCKYKYKLDFENVNNSQYIEDAKLGDVILQMRFSAKFHLQMCAVLSQANNHKDALEHARISALICEDNISKTLILFQQFKKNKGEFSELENVKDVKKVVEHLHNKIKKKKNKKSALFYSNLRDEEIYVQSSEKVDMKLEKLKNEELKIAIKKLLGKKRNEDWINFLNIGNIMYLSALNYDDLDLESDPKFEILRDAVLEKIVMLTVSYFCISTEIRFLEQNNKDKKVLDKSELWHSKSVELSSLYLPSICPLVKHYISSYHKHYTNNLENIPENEIVNSHIDFQRVNLEINDDPMIILKTKNVPIIKSLNLTKLNLNTQIMLTEERDKSNCSSLRDVELIKSSSHSVLLKKPPLTGRSSTKGNNFLLKFPLKSDSTERLRVINTKPKTKISVIVKMYNTTSNNIKANQGNKTPRPPSGIKLKINPSIGNIKFPDSPIFRPINTQPNTTRNMNPKGLKLESSLKKEEPNTQALPKIRKLKDVGNIEGSSFTMNFIGNKLRDYKQLIKSVTNKDPTTKISKLNTNSNEGNKIERLGTLNKNPLSSPTLSLNKRFFTNLKFSKDQSREKDTNKLKKG